MLIFSTLKTKISNLFRYLKPFAKKVSRFLVLTYIIFSGICLIGWVYYYVDPPKVVVQDDGRGALKAHVEAVMKAAGVYNGYTNARRDLFIDDIVRVAFAMLVTREEREYFVGMIATESGFDREAKSSEGAIGLSQLLPRYAQEFSDSCKLGKIKDSDLYDTEISLILGACHFRELLKITNGNITAALVGYNSGISSESFKQLMAGKNIDNTETASYATKIMYLHQKAKSVKNKDVKKELKNDDD